MHSEIENGKVLDFHYKKLNNGFYEFSIGDIYVGQVVKIQRRWSAIYGHVLPVRIGAVDGFGTRLDASMYLLKLRRLERCGELIDWFEMQSVCCNDETDTVSVPWGMWDQYGNWYPNHRLKMTPEEQHRRNVENGYSKPEDFSRS